MTVVTNKNEITRLVGYGSSGLLVDGEDDLDDDLERLRNQQHQHQRQWEDDDDQKQQQLKSFKSKAARIGFSLFVVASVVLMVTTAYSTGYNKGTAATTTATATNHHKQEGMMILDELVMTTTGSGSDKKGSDQNLHVSFDNTDAIVLPIRRKERKGRGCMFCHLNTAPPVVKEELVETMVFVDDDNNSDESVPLTTSVEVTPMTFTYNYELHNGQLLFTDPRSELIPNLQFDYAVLGLMSVQNINRETLENVSLDEVYVHHIVFPPLGMLGAEVLTADPLVYPKGYGYHVIAEEKPNIVINAHLLSNKDLKPINGSLPLARKLCNECYYAPVRSLCRYKVSGSSHRMESIRWFVNLYSQFSCYSTNL